MPLNLLVLLQMINLTSLILPTDEKNSSTSRALTRCESCMMNTVRASLSSGVSGRSGVRVRERVRLPPRRGGDRRRSRLRERLRFRRSRLRSRRSLPPPPLPPSRDLEWRSRERERRFRREESPPRSRLLERRSRRLWLLRSLSLSLERERCFLERDLDRDRRSLSLREGDRLDLQIKSQNVSKKMRRRNTYFFLLSILL